MQDLYHQPYLPSIGLVWVLWQNGGSRAVALLQSSDAQVKAGFMFTGGFQEMRLYFGMYGASDVFCSCFGFEV